MELDADGAQTAADGGDESPGSVLEGHTLVEHNGRQYMIPGELQRAGGTIYLQDLEHGGQDVMLVDSEHDEHQFILSQQDGMHEHVSDVSDRALQGLTL